MHTLAFFRALRRPSVDRLVGTVACGDTLTVDGSLQEAHAVTKTSRGELASALAEVKANMVITNKQRQKQGLARMLEVLQQLREAAHLHDALRYRFACGLALVRSRFSWLDLQYDARGLPGSTSVAGAVKGRSPACRPQTIWSRPLHPDGSADSKNRLKSQCRHVKQDLFIKG